MAIKISPRFEQKITLLVLIPLALFTVGFFFFVYKFQSLPKTSNDSQAISEPKNKKETVPEEPEVSKSEIVWGEPEVWQFNAEDTKDWKTYTSPNLGVSFKYPPNDWYPKDFGQQNNFIIDVTAPVATPSVGNFYEGQELSLLISTSDEDFVSDVNSIEEWKALAMKYYQKGSYLYNYDGKETKISLVSGTDIKGFAIRKASQNYYVAHFTGKNGSYSMSVQISRKLSEEDLDKYIDIARKIAFTLD